VRAIAAFLVGMFSLIGAFAALAGIPFDLALRVWCMAWLIIASAVGLAALLKRASRHPTPRSESHGRVERATAELVPPAPRVRVLPPAVRQIEAPKREVEVSS
jgi:hypothetical protein